jgi:hypothetical protein
VDFSRPDRDRITVVTSNTATALDRIDNNHDSVINAADRNVTPLNLDQLDGPDSFRLDFGDGNTLTVVGITSLMVNQDIFFANPDVLIA